MSGTSLDGLDVAYMLFDTENWHNFHILHAETIAYDSYWQEKLKNAFAAPAEYLMELDVAYGIFLGNQINNFIQKHRIEQVDLIASHGHTVFHQPSKAFTTQIGSGAHINAVTRIKTVSNFRMQDVALGGQGAPLVPIGDRLLFGNYDYCLNLGGFANISFEKNNQRKAFDICPANIVLNHYAQKTGKKYDDKGNLARSGKLIPELLNRLNQLDFYRNNEPKSLGWEFVQEKILPLIDRHSQKIPDILHTFSRHIAEQIEKKTDKGTMLVTGGGTYNQYLVEQIQKSCATKIVIPDKMLIDFKEALIFGLLGLLREQNQINVLSSVTGSRLDHSSGIIFNAFKK